MRILLVILAALMVAGGTGFYVMQGLRPASPEPTAQIAAPALKQVFVPAHELAAGTIIAPERLARMDVTESALTAQMIVADPAGEAFLAGSVARQALPQGVPIARSAIVQPGDRGFLAAVLPKGRRAITISISETAGLGGLILPGDRVDLILTYSVSGDIIEAERDIRASETMMRNIRVLALDQRLGKADQSAETKGKAETPPIARTATLEVTPQQAEMVTLAQTLGSVSLVLNSVRDGGEPDEQVGADETLPAQELISSRGRMLETLLPRKMTLDSDVTSLLRRQLATADTAPTLLAESPVPLPDRTTRVQVVRGVKASAIQLGFDAAAAPAAAPHAPPAE